MNRYTRSLIAIGVAVTLPFASALPQRAGQSVTVRTGTVTGAQEVDLNDKSALGGALVGGAFGAALTRSSKGSSRRDRNAALGAIIGGTAAAASRKPGRIYTVRTNEGTAIQIATEQTEIQVDDCVFVEEAGGSANIRRAPQSACQPEAAAVMKEPEMVAEMQEEASECAAAKQELVNAESDAAIERAVQKVKLLCYD
jgi:outer membrane lipoprotein SlyB